MPEDDGGASLKSRASRRIRDRLSPSRSRSASDEAYLSYYDIRLTQGDVDTLRDDWLTDNVISFWEEYLEHEYLARHPRCKVVLLRPTMAMMLLHTSPVQAIKSALPPMSDATHVFLPLNNNTDVEHAEGGTHWSLLLVSVKDNLAFHYDSLNSTNLEVAEKATSQLRKLLNLRPQLRFVNIEESPQQENGSDCGIFVCLLMQHLLVYKLLNRHVGEQIGMDVDQKAVRPHRGRVEIRKIIEELAEKGRRRRSTSRRSSGQSASPPRIGPPSESP